MGAINYSYIVEHIHVLKGAIVEIGSSSNIGEGSTEFFAGLVCGLPNIFTFHTVDILDSPYKRALHISSRIKNMNAYKAIGEIWLEEDFPKLDQKICYAYLDNADWNWWENKSNEPNWIKNQRQDYIDSGVEYNNEASANAHLKQVISISKYASA